MRLHIVGCGDAFGSGGRLQTCFHVAAKEQTFLIDCGATALIGMNRLGLAPNDVGTIVISHLHGDHFSGLVWWLLHAQYSGKRLSPLTIVGPRSLEARLHMATDALFSGAWDVSRRFDLKFVEFDRGDRLDVNGIEIETFEVSHPSGALSAALRLGIDSRTIAFSGDTEWVEALVPCAAAADLFITECYNFERPVSFHMNWQTLSTHLDRMTARKILISHMSPDMLANRDRIFDPRIVLAEDGLVLDL